MLRLISSFICYLTGASIYLLWGSRQLLGHQLLDAIGLSDITTNLRQSVNTILQPDWVRYNLPDALWTIAYILLIDFIFRRDSSPTRLSHHSLLWAAIIPIIGILSEILQGFGLMPGTWDILDLLSYASPYIVYSILYIYL